MYPPALEGSSNWYALKLPQCLSHKRGACLFVKFDLRPLHWYSSNWNAIDKTCFWRPFSLQDGRFWWNVSRRCGWWQSFHYSEPGCWAPPGIMWLPASCLCCSETPSTRRWWADLFFCTYNDELYMTTNIFLENTLNSGKLRFKRNLPANWWPWFKAW